MITTLIRQNIYLDLLSFVKTIGFRNPFKNSVLNTQNVTLNKSSKYTDMMLYKFVK